MDKYLLDLINKMGKPEDKVTNSDESISFQAHREAETLTNNEYITQLVEYIKLLSKPKDKIQRRNSYFVLSKLLTKQEDINAVQFLINQIQRETDKYIISSILDSLAYIDKPLVVDIDPILKCLKNDKWLIRHSAINSLKKSENSIARQSLLNIITNVQDLKKEQLDITYAISGLADIGQKEDIPVLEKLLQCKIRDVKDSAKFAIENIKTRKY